MRMSKRKLKRSEGGSGKGQREGRGKWSGVQKVLLSWSKAIEYSSVIEL